ncbi:hypothetical protein Poli38472_000371 [Pythium oligandrum]|uniref:Uncharacterized protein n=1 Tax=Pythium oligandrum TaxID=41045 RepID=A0A8K1FGS9_PYTOL|nr:hypothetical protein Poli38472_000371 [Pythium oligandrum]|eukprot:TMW60329.1 hypothetical protein Poli38472_000371 [Pythium oligandrum]
MLIQDVELPAGCELRLGIGLALPLHVKLVSESAEIFGQELTVDVQFTLWHQHTAIFSWDGAKLQLEGEPRSMEISSDTQMKSYSDVHRELASAVKCRLAADTQVNASGCIIRTSGWVKDIGYDLLEEAIQAFEVHTVLVLGDYQLNYRLETFQDHQRSANRFSVIHLEQPNGVVALDRKYLVNRRAHRIEDYFYGPSSFVQPLPLFYPETMECTMDAVEFFQVRGKRRLACCGDSTATPDRPVVTRREVSRSMANTLVAVMSCDPLATVPCDHSWLLVAPVCCFVIVKDVRPRDNVISLLVPNTGPLPSKYLLTGSITGLITR